MSEQNWSTDQDYVQSLDRDVGVSGGNINFGTTISTNGLVNYYDLQTGSGSTLKDKVGNKDGTINNSVFSREQVLGGSYSLYSDRSVVGIDDVPVTDLLPSPDYTLSIWAHPLSDDGGRVALERTSRFEHGITSGEGTTGQWSIFDRPDGNFTLHDIGSINLGSWQMITMSYNASTDSHKGYYNGSLSVDVTTPAGSSESGSSGFISGEFGAVYDGYIDEMRIWDRELSASEVADLYNVTRIE